jgi:acyl-CoA synthetase (NDP forming)
MRPFIVSTPAEVVSRLLRARSVAVVGASDDGTKASGRTLRYLLRYGYTGAIYPVNPRREQVQGVHAYPSLADLPEVPELAVVVLPASAVPGVLRQCGEIGIGVAIVFASGFAEVGPAGVRAQEELVAVAREAGVRVLGPNCVGAVGASAALTAAFMTGLDQDRFELKDDGVAFVTQSGAMGAFILNMAQSTGLGLGRFVSTGNEADISLPEVIEGLVEDESTRVVLGYVEGIREASSFRAALEHARDRRVPVCLMKVGRSERGATAAQSHTGALAGQDTVYDGLFEQYGVFRATDVDHLLDLGRILASTKRPAGPRLSIVTLSGGAGVLMTDAADDVGLEVPRWDDEWAGRMAAVLPDFASVRNPIDTTGIIASDQQVLRDAVDVCLEHPGTDVVMVMLGNMEREENAVCQMLAEAAAGSTKPIIVVWVGGSGRPVELLAAHGIPTFPEPVRAVRAVAALVRWATRFGAAPLLTSVDETPETSAHGGADTSGTAALRTLDEVAAKKLLHDHGIRTVPEYEAQDPAGAVDAADRIGYPVVVKLLSEEVPHKSDHGLVKVGLPDQESVRRAAEQVLGIAESMGVTDRRLVVQALVPSSTELILGMRRDPVFGPVVALGIGGVLTELASDVQVRVPPLTAADVESMVDGLRYRAVLEGARGRTPVDRKALVETVLRFVDLVTERGAELDSLEINPLLVGRDGLPVAVDALAVCAEPADETAPELDLAVSADA